MATRPKLLAFAGSARDGSLNKKLAGIAAGWVEEAGGEVTYVDLPEYPMPLYDGDLDAHQGIPPFAQDRSRPEAATRPTSPGSRRPGSRGPARR